MVNDQQAFGWHSLWEGRVVPQCVEDPVVDSAISTTSAQGLGAERCKAGATPLFVWRGGEQAAPSQILHFKIL